MLYGTLLASDLLSWKPKHGHTLAGCPTITYVDQITRDAGCLYEDLPKLIQVQDVWWWGVKNVQASLTILVLLAIFKYKYDSKRKPSTKLLV